MFHESSLCNQCERFCGNGRLYPAVARKLTCSIQRLNLSTADSLLKKYLTDNLYHKLKRKKTSKGTTLLDCIQSGVENLDYLLGIYAPDEECYKTFAPLFEPIIQDFHNLEPNVQHPEDDWGNPKKLKNLDKKIIVTVTISCKRALKSYPFPSKLNKQQFIDCRTSLEEQFKLIKKPPELKGKFIPYELIEGGVLAILEKANAMFKPDSRFLEAADTYNYWPEGRALFMNNKKNFFIWFNEEDHFKLISYNKGPKLKDAYATLSKCEAALKKLFPFIRDEKLGYLTVNPANIGTTLKFEIVAKCPFLLQAPDVLNKIIKKFGLEADIPQFAPDEPIPKTATVTFRNKTVIGITEFDIAMNMQNAMLELTEAEKTEEKRPKK